MSPLLQHLKDLEPDAFHQLVFSILRERFPNLDVVQVAGKGGDKGVDTFRGSLAARPIIWQSKFFRDGVKKPQKKQIKASLVRVLQNFRPSEWILCLPADLDIGAHSWFQQLQRDYEATVKIKLFAGSQIALELMHLRTIRNVFFPNAVLDVSEIKSLILKTGVYSDEELAKLNKENVEQYLNRLKTKESRFYYELSFLREGAQPEQRPAKPGLVLSVSDGETRLDLYPRDVEALRVDPPRFRLAFRREAQEKLQRFIRKGSPTEFSSDEVRVLESSFDHLFPEVRGPKSLRLGLAEETLAKRIATSVKFSHGTDSIEYPFVEFRPVRLGTDELELIGKDKSETFSISVVIPLRATLQPGDFHFTYNFPRRTVKSVLKAVKAAQILRAGGNFAIYDLEHERYMLKGRVTHDIAVRHEPRFEQFVEEVAEIARYFDKELTFPAELPQNEGDSFEQLLEIARTGRLKLSGMGHVQMNLIKSKERESAVVDSLDKEIALRWTGPKLLPEPVLFGIPFDTGPCLFDVKQAVAVEAGDTKSRYSAAAEGEPVNIKYKLLSDIDVTFERFAAQHSDIGRTHGP